MLTQIILRLVVNAIAIVVTAALLPGITITDDGIPSLIVIAAIIAIANAIIKPILLVLTCPFTLLTLGLFVLVVNGFVLWLVGELSGERLVVENFGWAIVGGIIMAIVSIALETGLGMRGDRRRR